MNLIKKMTSLLLVLLLFAVNVFAEETTNVSFKATIDGDNVTVVETESESDADNSNLSVRVTNDTETVIYEGVLGEYENGRWAFIDFNEVACWTILDWETMEAIHIVPIPESTDETSSVLSETVNINGLNTTSDENTEQSSAINTIQLIEYDVTYSIISDNSLSMNIDYNVYNGNSENDTVSLIAALYENGRLSDIKTQSLSINALDSNSDSILLPLPDNRENYSVKLMVWDGMGTLRPIGNSKQVVDLDDYAREKYMYITSNANVGFNVYMNAATVKGTNDGAVHTLKYDSSKILPVDLCGFTYNKELTAGEVSNTNITIQNADLSDGKIEYKFNLQNGRNTGITNMVKFKTLSDVTGETIVYTIQ